jgi:hypothetical protein
MSKTYRLGVVLLSAAAVVMMPNSQSFGQRIKIGGGSNQSDKDKKDKDDNDDKDRKKDNDRDNNNQNNQGGNTGKSEKSAQSQFQQLFKNQQNQNNQGQNNPGPFGNQGQNFQGKGGQNKFGGNNKIGFPGQQFQKLPGDDDHDRDHKEMRFGSWRGDKWEGSNKAENWARAFGYKKTSLFGEKWYRDHPQAWRYDNNRANVWVTASVPGVYSWLGWGNVPQQYQAYYGNAPQFDASHYGEWYPLGVYSLMAHPDDMGTRIVQLAVDRHGHLAGTYFDMITDAENSVVGEINRQTQRAEWSPKRNPDVRFRASIYRLLQPSGYVTVQLPGGEQRWQFVRLEN